MRNNLLRDPQRSTLLCTDILRVVHENFTFQFKNKLKICIQIVYRNINYIQKLGTEIQPRPYRHFVSFDRFIRNVLELFITYRLYIFEK